MKIYQNKEVTRIEFEGVNSSWKQKILFLSDIHIDSVFCDRKLLKKHLDEAVNENAIILINGDNFDCMQGKNDPRRSYRELKENLRHNDYFDCVLEDAVDFYKPYARNIAMVGYGNHEYSVIYNNGTDLVQRFAYKMREHGSDCVAGGYQGCVRLITRVTDKVSDSYRIFYNHGAGGEAPVTQGMINVNRQSAWLENFQCVWNGHNHKTYITHQAVFGYSNKDEPEMKLRTFIRTPGYKNEFTAGGHGFAASRNMSPTPVGCIWGEYSVSGIKMHSRYYADVN